MNRVCENCGGEGADDDDLAPVHRMYVVPESWESAGSSQTLEETELWCFSCRSQYPNEPADDDAE